MEGDSYATTILQNCVGELEESSESTHSGKEDAGGGTDVSMDRRRYRTSTQSSAQANCGGTTSSSRRLVGDAGVTCYPKRGCHERTSHSRGKNLADGLNAGIWGRTLDYPRQEKPVVIYATWNPRQIRQETFRRALKFWRQLESACDIGKLSRPPRPFPPSLGR
eukprot:3423964-Amphidinium_carterae.1